MNTSMFCLHIVAFFFCVPGMLFKFVTKRDFNEKLLLTSSNLDFILVAVFLVTFLSLILSQPVYV